MMHINRCQSQIGYLISSNLNELCESRSKFQLNESSGYRKPKRHWQLTNWRSQLAALMGEARLGSEEGPWKVTVFC